MLKCVTVMSVSITGLQLTKHFPDHRGGGGSEIERDHCNDIVHVNAQPCCCLYWNLCAVECSCAQFMSKLSKKQSSTRSVFSAGALHKTTRHPHCDSDVVETAASLLEIKKKKKLSVFQELLSYLRCFIFPTVEQSVACSGDSPSLCLTHGSVSLRQRRAQGITVCS
jgi:hypothetical protein